MRVSVMEQGTAFVRLRGWVYGASLALSFVMAGCRGGTGSKAAKSATQQYPMRGVVVSLDAPHGELELKHNAVPGLMEAMTMSYKLEDPAALSEVHPGDVITATLLAEHDAAGPLNMRLKDVVVIAQAKPDYKPAVQYHVPAAGDDVPDFKLLNQSGKTIGLKQFRGKVVLLTFIYTRCPLADFCPRMSHSFAEIDKALVADPALYAKTHLLSVSFDPAYDTPKVLRSYGAAYTGRYTRETFSHWDFAAPPVGELAKVEQFFDLGVTPGPDGSLQHSLSTVVIGRDGKVAAFYPTNEWTTADVLAEIRKAAA